MHPLLPDHSALDARAHTARGIGSHERKELQPVVGKALDGTAQEPSYRGHTLHPPPMRVQHARAQYTVKGEDMSRTCSIELSEGVVVQFYAILDGHGGPRAARFGAEHLPALIASHYAETDEREGRGLRLQAACKAAFISLDEQFAQSGPFTDGTTATCVIVDGEEVTVANVGDSAAVLYLPGDKSVTLSADHRVSRRSPAEHNRLVEAGAQIGRIKGRDGLPVGPERIYPGGLSVTRSIGDNDSTKAAIPEPDVVTITLPPCGGMIVLASDGVWDFVDGAHVERLAASSRKPKCGAGWLSRALMRTVNQANMEIDDATLICIELKKPGADDEIPKAPVSMGAKMKKIFGFGSKSKDVVSKEHTVSSGSESDLSSESDGSNKTLSATQSARTSQGSLLSRSNTGPAK